MNSRDEGKNKFLTGNQIALILFAVITLVLGFVTFHWSNLSAVRPDGNRCADFAFRLSAPAAGAQVNADRINRQNMRSDSRLTRRSRKGSR